MRLAWHIVRHDVRQFHIGIAVWLMLTAAASFHQGYAPFLEVGSPALAPIAFGATVGVAARWLLGVSLIVMIVQAHPLVGTTAFWMTRPIAPGVLMRSRLLLFGILFVLFPGLCDLVLMSAHAVPFTASGRVIAESSIVRTAGVLLVMVAAAATATFGRFVLLVAGCLTAAMLAFAAGMISLMRSSWGNGEWLHLPGNGILAVTGGVPDQTGPVVAWLVGIAGLLLAVRSRYRRGAIARAGLLGGTAAVTALMAATLWPWPLLHAAVVLPSWASSEGTLKLSAPSPQAIYFDNGGAPWNPDDRPRWRMAHGRVYLTSLPDNWHAMARLTRGALRVAGQTVESGTVPYAVPLPIDAEGRDTRLTALERALQVETINGSRLRDTTGSAPLIRVLSTDAPAAGFGEFEGEFEIALHEVQLAGVLPLRPGVRFQDGAYRLTLTGLRLTEGGPRLDVRWSDASSIFDRAPNPTHQVFLRNRREGEALSGELRSHTPAIPLPDVILFARPRASSSARGFQTQAGVIGFPSTVAAQLPSARLPNGRYSFEDEPWVRDAEVVVIRTVHRGVVRRPVTIDRVAVNGGSPPNR